MVHAFTELTASPEAMQLANGKVLTARMRLLLLWSIRLADGLSSKRQGEFREVPANKGDWWS